MIDWQVVAATAAGVLSAWYYAATGDFLPFLAAGYPALSR